MKKEYSCPIIEVISLSNEDVITTSALGTLPGDNEGDYGAIN